MAIRGINQVGLAVEKQNEQDRRPEILIFCFARYLL